MNQQQIQYWFLFNFFCVALLATPAGAEKPKMLVMDLKASLVEEEIVSIITDLISTELSSFDQFEIITGADMRQMAQLEAEKQSLGCIDDSSCLAELAGAMGARLVVYGSVGKLGKNIIITLNLFDSQKAKSVGRENIRATTLDTLPDQIPPAVSLLISGVVQPPKADVPAKVAKAEPKPEPEPPKPQEPKATNPQKEIKKEPKIVDAPPPEEQKAEAAVTQSSSALMMGAGIGAMVIGALAAGMGTWGLTSATGILAQADASASSKEMAVATYEAAPLLIGLGGVALLGGGAILFWPAQKVEE